MTKLAADYLNRAQIARRVKARAIDAQRKVLPQEPLDDGREIAGRIAQKPRHMASPIECDTRLIQAA